MRAYIQELIDAHLCVDCRVNEPVEGLWHGKPLVRCAYCLEEKVEKEKKLYAKHKADGICGCGGELRPRNHPTKKFWASCEKCRKRWSKKPKLDV